MSEYQYYEFVAIDQPLTAKQQSELRALSTRARITSSGFANDYQWGDLKGDPRVWMEKYFDAHLYLANWGSHRVALRLPRSVLAPDIAARYCVGASTTSWSTRTHVILDLSSVDEDGDEELCEPDGRLAAIVPARAELAAGDLRLLYLVWLLAVQDRELDDDELEPPVPAGLAELSGPQQALAEFLRLDVDLLAAAAAASEPMTPASDSVLRRWVKALPAADKDDLLVRVLSGDGRAEMLRRFHGGSDQHATDGRRTVGELLLNAERLWERREASARRREDDRRRRHEKAAAEARALRLAELAKDADAAWDRVDALIATKKPKEYDDAVMLLVDLRDLAFLAGGTDGFEERMRLLRVRHARKASLLDRLARVRLD